MTPQLENKETQIISIFGRNSGFITFLKVTWEKSKAELGVPEGLGRGFVSCDFQEGVKEDLSEKVALMRSLSQVLKEARE